MALRIKNWGKHQHFKDRTPPWIKLYRELLDNPDWHDLSGNDSKVLIGLWLIASEDETHSGCLPDVRRLAFRLRMKESELNQSLNKLSEWLIDDDIKPISNRYQSDAPETEAERETEAEECAKLPSILPPERIVIQLPLVDKTEHGITESQYKEWVSAYPAVDVSQQLRQMRQWCLANPSNRKTRKGINAFIVRWLAKEQDKGRAAIKQPVNQFAGGI